MGTTGLTVGLHVEVIVDSLISLYLSFQTSTVWGRGYGKKSVLPHGRAPDFDYFEFIRMVMLKE